LLLVSAFSALASGDESVHAGSADEAGRQTYAASLLVPFKQELMHALTEGMATGPESAIAACSIQAPGIAAALSVDGVRVGRTSHRLRNSANEGPEWVAPILARYLEREARPVIVTLDDDRVGYVEPIMLAPLCTSCHGESIAPGVADAIAERYPDDEATGFAIGDLRGVFWVEFPAQ
jgi:hypothetical protein